MMTADILLEFKDKFIKSKRYQQVVRFFISLAYHGRSDYLLSDPSSKKKKVNEDWEIALFEDERNNRNSKLLTEIEKLNNQFQ